MISVIFKVDFATKKVGEVFECDEQLASHLVNQDKVADYYSETESKKAKSK